ncbi:phospholipid phosphatase 1-like [Ostrea edulis]|uniref:phospholipid phosphatase 1-like n=1 Tax=Ostrea edulis TaxID=37623 RepID=UPI0024AF5737|nr:phospholipid phosphatase 1-like [Ostrea edulis]XP_056021261.1 phospholipid phosphatase 1-like [Ostrea edulis]XP_056021262.1 phospholipid phosphatase 1-like [Ostrea edulis]XP_056021263.1 phospholipid phosphatase 1-like [Ostrea edulis]XP_056021264.1 phospholipid phosphatase 1-like [Ostrea edulis]XP_056021265.1 phospholipid phosphatase 1-like [Ostrea edulis]XP_056021266.1 phospholipid phosphatase 1-like [Ostrea edulis]
MAIMSRTGVVQVITDVIVFIAVVTFALLFSFNKLTVIQPYMRGFFCDDQNLMYPYREESISTIMATILSTVPPTVIIIFTEAMLLKKYSQKRKTFMKNCYSMIGGLCMGLSMCVLFIEIVKMFVGRLRPHFFAVCQPNFTATNCSRTFVTSYTCQGKHLESVLDAKKSFPSGHSGAAWYSMTYLIIYIQIRVRRHWPMLRVACPMLQLVAICLAAYISISRLQDYKHHSGDVIGGGIIGTIFSVIVMYQNSKIRQGFRQHYDEANFSETMDTIICKELQQANHISTEKTESNGQAGYWREAP